MKLNQLTLIFFMNAFILNAQSLEQFTNIQISNTARAFSFNDEMFYVQENNSGGCYLAKIKNLNTAQLPLNEEVFIIDLPGIQSDYKDLEYLQEHLYILATPTSGINKVIKVDINSTNPEIVEIMNSNISGISEDGENLFINQTVFNSISSNYNLKIYKYTASSITPELNLLADLEKNDFNELPNWFGSLNGLGQPYVIANKMYFGFGVIYVIDLNSPNFNNYIYYSSYYATRLAADHESNSIFIINDSTDSSSVRIIDVSQNPPRFIFEKINILRSGGMQFYHNQYIYDGPFRYYIGNVNVLSTQENEIGNSLKLFPNPTNSYLEITNQRKKLEFEIYNIEGKKILKGILKVNEKLNINRLQTGQYILKIKNTTIQNQAFIFIKK